YQRDVHQGGSSMPRTHRPYPPEFRAEAVRLVRESGKPMKVIAQDLGIALESLRKWVRQAEIDAGEREGLTTQEREELQRLRREVKILREEREILKKPQPSSPRRPEVDPIVKTQNLRCLSYSPSFPIGI